jgi:hypothetical protein
MIKFYTRSRADLRHLFSHMYGQRIGCFRRCYDIAVKDA